MKPLTVGLIVGGAVLLLLLAPRRAAPPSVTAPIPAENTLGFWEHLFQQATWREVPQESRGVRVWVGPQY